MSIKLISKTKSTYRCCNGAITEEAVVSLWFLFVFMFFPLLDYSAMGLRAFFLWYACEQGAMAGAKGTEWSTTSYANNYYTSIQTQAKNTVTNVIGAFSGITLTSGPTLTVIAQAIPNTSATTIDPYVPTTSTFLDKSLYVPLLQVAVTGQIQPFIVIPFLPVSVPGVNTAFTMSVNSQQQIENPSALSY
jgi:hypothetical protein